MELKIEEQKGEGINKRFVKIPIPVPDQVELFKDLLSQTSEWKVLKSVKTPFKATIKVNFNVSPFMVWTEAVLPYLNPKELFDVFDKEILKQTDWNPHWNSVEKANDQEIYCTKIKMPIVSDREFVDEKTWYIEDSSYYVIFQSVHDTPSLLSQFPRSKKYVRGFNHINGYKFTESENCTKYTQISQVEIGGYIPKYLITKLAPSASIDFIKWLLSHLSHF